MLYLRDYFRNKTPKKLVENIYYSCGIFSVKYDTLSTMPPDNSFGLYSWKSFHLPIQTKFYKNNELLFIKEFTRSPSIVIHGDGITEKGTFFTFNDNSKLQIYNMNQELIRTVCIGSDIFVEFKRVNDKYAISIAEECCTYDPCTGLVNLDMLFGIKECDDKRPYDDSRVHVPLTCENQNYPTLVPVVATEKGFIVTNKNDLPISYEFTEENLVLYDDVFNGVVDFYEGSESIDLLESLGVSEENKNKINECMAENGSVNVSLEKLSDNEKDTVFNKISNAYFELNEKNKKEIQQTFAMIKPDAVSKGYTEEITKSIRRNGFKIISSKEFTFNSDTVDYFYGEHKGKDMFPKLKEFMISGPVILLVLEAENAIKQWRKLIGPTLVNKARLVAPHTLRAIYGDDLDSTHNACHGSDSKDSAKREIEFFNKVGL